MISRIVAGCLMVMTVSIGYAVLQVAFPVLRNPHLVAASIACIALLVSALVIRPVRPAMAAAADPLLSGAPASPA